MYLQNDETVFTFVFVPLQILKAQWHGIDGMKSICVNAVDSLSRN